MKGGSVDRIVGEEGNMMKQGDTLLILTNPDLIRSIEDQRDEWEKQRITYKEKEDRNGTKESDTEATNITGTI